MKADGGIGHDREQGDLQKGSSAPPPFCTFPGECSLKRRVAYPPDFDYRGSQNLAQSFCFSAKPLVQITRIRAL